MVSRIFNIFPPACSRHMRHLLLLFMEIRTLDLALALAFSQLAVGAMHNNDLLLTSGQGIDEVLPLDKVVLIDKREVGRALLICGNVYSYLTRLCCGRLCWHFGSRCLLL